MRHLIKKWNSFRAGCNRPGCMVSLEGGVVEKMSKKELQDFFPTECPQTIEFDKKHNMNRFAGRKAIEIIIKSCREQIKGYEKTIEYWTK